MHNLVHFNGRIVDGSEAAIAALSSAALFGKGIFTTIAIHDGIPFQWDLHWRRLESNAAQLRIDISDFSPSDTKHALDELSRNNAVRDGRARITLFDESESSQWHFESRRASSLVITTSDFRALSSEVRICISPFRTNSASPLVGIKSCNYLDRLLAHEEAKKRGFDEAVQLNERGKVSSACMANIFWLRNGTLFTPSLSTGCLAGTTREFVIDNIRCEEVAAGVDELKTADEIFLTSAGIGITQVAEFDGQILNRSHHTVLDLLPIRHVPT